MVLGQDFGVQHGHAGLVGRLGEVAEQDGAEPVVLGGVGGGDGDLGRSGRSGSRSQPRWATTWPSVLLVAIRP